jgi:hypothetical protein
MFKVELRKQVDGGVVRVVDREVRGGFAGNI